MTALWKGHLPLPRAFWEYAIFYGALASIVANVSALISLSAGLPGAVAIGLFLAPVPYFLVCAVGVWRSAERYKGPPHWAAAAKMAVTCWFILMAVI